MDKKEPNLPPKAVPPGWNDPPEVTATVSSPKRLLHKRVPFPMTSPEQTPKPQVDTTLEDVLQNLSTSISKVEPNSSLLRDLDSMKTYWNNPNCPPEVRGQVLQFSKYIFDGEVSRAEEILTKLSAFPSVGWFSLFLHSVLNLFKTVS